MSEHRTCERCGSRLDLLTSGESFCARCLALGLAAELDEATTKERASVPLPRRFGAYELLEEIGRGGMGVVYRALQVALDRVVAVKLLLAGAYASEAMLRRFQIEAAAAARIQHPNIVSIHDYGECDGQPFYAMDCIAGRNLAEVCDGRPCETRRAVQLLEVLARAVQHAHEGGVVHRDLKPSNVLIDTDNQPRITDFGLAKRLDLADGITISGQMLGSPSYVAPEQAAGRNGQIGVPSDVYGLGALFYHLLTGRAPFNAATPTGTLRLVLETDPPPPRLLNPALPRDLETICLKCLEKEPIRRYATAREVAEDCERFLAQRPIRARPPSRVYRLRKLVRRHRLATLVLVLGTMTVAIGASLWIQTVRADALAQQRRDQIELIFARALHVADPGYSRGRQATLKDLLDDTARWVPDAFGDDPRLEADVHARIGETYCKLSLFESAVPHLEAAWAARQRWLPEDHPDSLQSLRDLGIVRLWQQRYAEAEEHFARVLAIQERTLSPDAEECLRTRDEVIFGRELRGVLGSSIPEADRANFIEAYEKLTRESYDLARHRWGDEHPLTLLHERNVARALLRGELRPYDQSPGVQERREEARNILVHCHELSARVHGLEHPNTIETMADLGRALLLLKRYDEALRYLEVCVPLANRVLGSGHQGTAFATQVLESALRDTGRTDEANILFPRYVAAWLQIYGPNNVWIRRFTFYRLHRLAVDYDRPDDAARFAVEHLAEFRDRRNLAPDSPIIGVMTLVLADARLAQDRPAEAAQHLREATEILAKPGGGFPPLWFVHSELGKRFREQQDLAAAEATFVAAYEGINRCQPWDPPTQQWMRDILVALIDTTTSAEQPTKAAEWQHKLEALNQEPWVSAE